MSERSIPASTFKAKCLALLDDVAATGEPLLVTKRGKPVARVVATEAAPSLRGSVTFERPDEDLIAPLEGNWDADER